MKRYIVTTKFTSESRALSKIECSTLKRALQASKTLKELNCTIIIAITMKNQKKKTQKRD